MGTLGGGADRAAISQRETSEKPAIWEREADILSPLGLANAHGHRFKVRNIDIMSGIYSTGYKPGML